MSGSYFYEWLFKAENFRGFRDWGVGGGGNTLSCFTLQKPGINSGRMGLLWLVCN